MSEAFDPYVQWLGIRDPQRPPNHYRLLGVDLFENDPDVLTHAADRQMSHVRNFQAGRHSALSQKLLNELAGAKVCLLHPQKKLEYDARLRQELAASTASAAPPPPLAGGPPAPAAASAAAGSRGVGMAIAALGGVAVLLLVLVIAVWASRGRGRANLAGPLAAAPPAAPTAPATDEAQPPGPAKDESPRAAEGGPAPAVPESPQPAEQPGAASQGVPAAAQPMSAPAAPAVPPTANAQSKPDAAPSPSPAMPPAPDHQPPSPEAPPATPSGGTPSETPAQAPGPPAEAKPETGAKPDALPPSSAEPKAAPVAAEAMPAKTDPASQPASAAKPESPSPDKAPPAAAAAASRLPVPSSAEQGEKLAEIRRLFDKEYKKAPDQRQQLARDLFKQAQATRDDPVARYVAYTEAADLALEAGDDRTFTLVIRALHDTFDIDPLAVKIGSFRQLSKKARPGAASNAIIRQALATAAEAMRSDRLAESETCIKLARELAQKIRETARVKEAVALGRDLDLHKQAQDEAARAAKVLATRPDDPKANLLQARYLGFVKGQWNEALPLLKKTSDEVLKSLAEAEQASPSDPQEMVKLGDRWWEAVNSLDEATRRWAQLRAGDWYRQAAPKLKGITRLRIEQQLKEIGDAPRK